MSGQWCRIWETRFMVKNPMVHLPVPHEIVFERQTSPKYYLAGTGRPQEMAQIVCTIAGEGMFRYGGTVWKLPPGTGFMCCLGDPESAYFYPPQAVEPWDFLWVDFIGETAVNIINEMSERHGHFIRFPEGAGFIKYLQSYRYQKRSMRFITATEGGKIACDIFAHLGTFLEINDNDSRNTLLVQAAQQLIMENLNRELTLKEIARRLQVSREHLSRVFREQTQMSPGAFALEERMNLARRLLRSHLYSCEEIAEMTGFSSSTSFARAFKTKIGISPTHFRK